MGVLVTLIVIIIAIIIIAFIISLVIRGIRDILPTRFRSGLPVGATCVLGRNCANKACGWSDGTRSDLICCPSGSTTSVVTRNYCTELDIGQPCFVDEMCTSSYCQGGSKLTLGTCQPTIADGNPCTVDDACKSKNCGLTSGDDGASKICCPNVYRRVAGGAKYCLGTATNGQICFVRSATTINPTGMCQSNFFCPPGKLGAVSGVCTPQQSSPGGVCENNGDPCNSGTSVCGWSSDNFTTVPINPAMNICCPQGAAPRFISYGQLYCKGTAKEGDFCFKRLIGDNNMCISGLVCSTCDDNRRCIGDTGKCQPLSEVGSICLADEECREGFCGSRHAGDDADTICCPGGKFETWGGTRHCTQIPSGLPCRTNTMCASGRCKGARTDTAGVCT